MTDRNAILDALADAVRSTPIPECQSGAAYHKWSKTIAAAVLELVGPRKLEWKTLGDGKGRYRLDSSISVARHAYGLYFVSLHCNSGSDYYWSGPAYSGSKYYPTLEAAQSAAQAHADAAHWANTALGAMIGGE